MCGRGVVCTHKVHTGGKCVVSGGVEWVLCAHTYEGRVLCVCSGCCVHTQGTHIGGESVVCGGVEWVLCAHT